MTNFFPWPRKKQPVRYHYLVTYAVTYKDRCFDFDQCEIACEQPIDYKNYMSQLNVVYGHAMKNPAVKKMALVNLLFLGTEPVKEEKK